MCGSKKKIKTPKVDTAAIAKATTPPPAPPARAETAQEVASASTSSDSSRIRRASRGVDLLRVGLNVPTGSGGTGVNVP